MGRLFWSLLFVAAGVLAQISPPSPAFWYLALAVTEWGHWLMVPILLIWLPGWQATGTGKLAALLALVAAGLVLTPVWKARAYAQVIQTEEPKLVGSVTLPATGEVPVRTAPLVLKDLIQGVETPSIQWRSQSYAKRGERDLEMDIYTPPVGAPRLGTRPDHPVVLVLHGGMMGPPWQSGDRQEALSLNRYLAGRGYVVVAIDYRLAPEAPYPAALEDVLEALKSLKGMGGVGGMDPSRVILLGRGGGAHLALMAAYASGDPSIRGVIALYPPTDLPAWHRTVGNPRVADWQAWMHTFLGAGLDAKSAALYEAASPRRYASTAPPTLLVHGARDPIVPASQSERLAASLREFQRSVLAFQLPWATHSCDINFHGPCGQATTFLVERFLARYAL